MSSIMGAMNFSTYTSLVATLYIVTIAFRKWRRAWERCGLAALPGPTGHKWAKGHVSALYNPDTALEFHDSLSEYGPVVKLYGVLGSLRLYVNDPYAMGEILLKEQNGFERTESYVSNLNMVLGPGLLGTRGVKHKAQRKLPTFQDVSHKLVVGIEKEIKAQGRQAATVDVFKWGYRCALDSVGRAGLGHDFQALDGVDSEYSKSIKHLLPALFSLAVLRPIMPTLYKVGPAWFRRAVIERLPSKAVKQLLSIVDVQHQQAIQIFEQKRAALKNNSGKKSSSTDEKNIITLMLRANEKANPEDRIPEDEMIGQIKYVPLTKVRRSFWPGANLYSTLIFAGHDTTSGTIACVLQMLAEHPEIQSELREELAQCSIDEPDYATLESFRLLEAVIKETLRLHPPAPVAERVSTRDTILPLRSQTRGEYSTTKLAVPAGTLVMLSLRTANRDPATWGTDSLEWNPHRWLEPLPTNVVDARVPGVYSHIMSFLGGPNSCIAYKFALLEAKVVISSLVRRFQFSPGDRPVIWKFGGTSKPFVVDPTSGASLPGLVLKLAVV